MKQDPDFKKARDNWATMPESERVAVLKKVANYQAEVYGTARPRWKPIRRRTRTARCGVNAWANTATPRES